PHEFADREHLREKHVEAAAPQCRGLAGRRVEGARRQELAPWGEAERQLDRLGSAPLPRPPSRRFPGVEPVRDLEVGLPWLLLVDLEAIDAIDEEDPLRLSQVAIPDQSPGAAPDGEAVRIDVAPGDRTGRVVAA